MITGTSICNRVRPMIGSKKLLLFTPMLHLSSALWFFVCPLEPLYLMIGQLLMILGNGIALPCAQAMVMQPYKKQAGAAAAMSGGGQMIVSSIVSMALVQLGLSQAELAERANTTQQSIDRIERHYFGAAERAGEGDEPDLRQVAETWIERTRGSR